ncbi:MAG: serpin family protein [Acidimicrobiaceae bacterium]|nr:serpin family protein [Acidimicrobiaceae bacterium]MYE55876.1 serpin family protein [Acidimicrobiaceae bacterium]
MAAQRSLVIDGLGNLGRGCNVQTAVTKLLGIVIVLCSMAAACGSSDTTTAVLEPVADRLPADPEAPVGEWAAGVNAAGWDFHRHLKGNAVSSPVSIGMAFSLSRAGASADSGATLDQIFGFPEAGVHDAANAVDLRLARASTGLTTLELANRLFPDDGFSILPEFLHTAAAQYGAALQPVDTADGAAAAAAINEWVSERTRGLIPVIISDSVVQDQELVLVNTVYLKADWVEPFLPEWTSDGQFTTADNRSVTVPFMRDREPLRRRFVQLGTADAVELPYRGGQLAMWLIVPHDPAGLTAVEASLDAEALTALPSAAQTGLVDLTMPKWEQTLPPTDLFEWLCPQGFCAGALFDGIAPGIFISAALHGAKVIVDEKGTEAAAATALSFEESGPPPADLTIVADRPFLWAIVHPPTGTLLFVGRLVDPAA